jgi:hypothetical protein
VANKTITDIISAANAIFLTVPGIKRAYAEAPDTPPSGSGDLPCVIPIVESVATPPAQAFGFQRKDYSIKFLLLVATYSKGLVAIEKQARPFIDSVPDAFFPHVKLNDSGIDHANVDEMHYKALEYTPGGAVYVGYEVMLSATIKNVLAQGV